MIKVNFSAYGTYVTDSLYQWDINRTLIVNGLNLEQNPEIHFYNANMERAIVRQATLDNGIVTVTIPNTLLQEAFTIKADVCIYESNVRKTIENIEIPVKAKARPLDYTFVGDDEDVYSFNELKRRVSEAEEKYNTAITRYNEMIDQFGRVIAEYPSVPDRVTALEDTTARITTFDFVGNGTGAMIIEYDHLPKLIFISEGTPGKFGTHLLISYGAEYAEYCYYDTSNSEISTKRTTLSWYDNYLKISMTMSSGDNPLNHKDTTYKITIVY